MRDEVAETAAFDERETAPAAGRRRPRAARRASAACATSSATLGLLGYDDDFLGVALARNLKAATRSGAVGGEVRMDIGRVLKDSWTIFTKDWGALLVAALIGSS